MIYLDPFKSRPWAEPTVRMYEGETRERSDAWENVLTGYGTARDKTTASCFGMVPLINDVELEALFYNSSIAAKAVEKPVDALFRAGFDLEGDDEKGRLLEWLKSVALPRYKWAAKMGRNFGGSILWLGTSDPDPSLPWAQDKPILFFEELDRRFVTPWSFYRDPTSAKYGEVEKYLVADPLVGRSVLLHETRVIRFEGVKADKRTRLNFLKGWGFSILQRSYEDLRSAGVSFRALENLLSDASQAVLKIKNLNAKLSTDRDETIRRLRILDQQRSSGRAIALDADGESFERSPTPFAGIPDTMDRVMIMIAASFDMPVSVMFGKQPSGLQATGDAELEGWYNSIRELGDMYLPSLQVLARLGAITLGMSPDAVKLTFCNPAQANAVEEATVYKTQAEADQIYITNGVVLAEEVAMSRFGPDNDAGLTIDMTAREKSLKLELENMANPPEVQPNEQDPNAKPGQKAPGDGAAPVPGSSPGA